jgi:hypothetical protein
LFERSTYASKPFKIATNVNPCILRLMQTRKFKGRRHGKKKGKGFPCRP